MKSVPLDINMVEINTCRRKKFMFPALMWVKSREAKLRSFSLQCTEDDYGIVASVLNNCDTSVIQKLEIGSQPVSILEELWWDLSSENGMVEEQWLYVLQSRNYHDMAVQCGVQPYQISPPSILGNSIVRNASNLKRLKIKFTEEKMNRLSFKFLTQLEQLEELDFSVVYRQGVLSKADFRIYNTLFIRLGETIEKISKLRVLKLSKPHLRNDCSRFKVRSETLEEINTIGVGKGCWCDEVICPSLKLFTCKGLAWGNGIRARLTPVGAWDFDNVDICGLKRAGDFPCEAVSVPNSCIFEFTSSREWGR
mmetsp:Transcript_27227/g.33652  ORF Transcript_27227/g.33652 Transcript_27227/m.33652 type:complete len:309 (+) Transcript_27227:810-1736(+)